MSKRAERRYHLRRMKAKARKVFYWCPERAHHWANNMTMCSRACCGNPRKWNKEKTRQEYKSDIELEEE